MLKTDQSLDKYYCNACVHGDFISSAVIYKLIAPPGVQMMLLQHEIAGEKFIRLCNPTDAAASSLYIDVIQSDDTINLHEASSEYKAFIKMLNTSLNDSTSL